MKYGLIGERLSHSFSAQIHQQLFDYSYELKEIPPMELHAFLTEKDFCAVNVTIPYKETVLSYLDVVDEVALQIGAVNTIVNRDGRLYGYNTDFDGLLALIEHSKIGVAGKKVLILGSGGTSKTAMAVVQELGCASMHRVSRSAREGCISYEQAVKTHSDAQVLINTTPCGMFPHGGESMVDINLFPCLEGVVDVVYNPLRTKLVCDASRLNIPAVGGLYMLVAQAARAAEHFVGKKVPRERIETIFRKLKSEKENIVLVGMPGCGKSTVGESLAQLMGRELIDTDTRIVEEMGCSIPELFRRIGEMGFRDTETALIRDIAALQGKVIATGGGAVLRPENVALLKENGRVYFLDRSLSLLTATSDRPLSSTTEALQARYEERYPIYCGVCDVHMAADGTIDHVVNKIREDFLYEHFGD